MRENYQKALRYAMKCGGPLYKDLTHAAYIRHFNKFETNLFDQNIYFILRYIRNEWYIELNRWKYMSEGVYYKKQFLTAEDLPLCSKTLLPDEELISKDFCEALFKQVDDYHTGTIRSLNPKVLRNFLELLDAGYTSAEICEQMNITHQMLYYYKKKLQKIINEMEMKSPFNGHALRVSKKITRKTFENSPQYKDYKYNPDLDCDRNEFYEIVTNGTDYILIREKAD